jgi:hypothetical protein
VVYEHKEGLCCSSRRLIGHQKAATLSGLTGADALDSYLVTGGFPEVVRTKMNRSLKDFFADQLADDGTRLVTTGRLILDSEFGSSAQARTILSVIGEGLRKRADIAAGGRRRHHQPQAPARLAHHQQAGRGRAATSLGRSVGRHSLRDRRPVPALLHAAATRRMPRGRGGTGSASCSRRLSCSRP